jgi:signal transduction histidine kinase
VELTAEERRHLRDLGSASRLDEDRRGERRRTTWVAVDRDDSAMGAIQLVETLELQDDFVEASNTRAIFTAASAAGLAALLVYVFFRLWDAQNRAEREAESRKATLEQLRHAQRLGTVGKLASGLAHELGTPLNVVAGRAKMIARGESDGASAVKDAKVIGEQAERMTAIIQQLLDFARSGAASRERIDVAAVGRRAISMLEPMAEKKKVALLLEGADGEVHASCDARQLEQVMSNLVLNAIQAQEDGGEVRVEVSREDGEVQVAVEDRGPGVPEELRERIFEPFYTTKDVGEGTGLGLSVAWGIVNEHGGRIGVSDRPGGGARFTLTLPMAEDR